MSSHSAENDAPYVIEGHRIDYLDHRFVCRGCGARLLNLMQFQTRECPTPIPPGVPDCTCTAGNDAGFPAQHATLCPRFAHPRVFPPEKSGA